LLAVTGNVTGCAQGAGRDGEAAGSKMHMRVFDPLGGLRVDWTLVRKTAPRVPDAEP
jgi:hypothetical protein